MSFGVGLLSLRKGDLDKAIATLEHGFGLCQVWLFLGWFGIIASCLGYAYALSGRIAQAVPLVEQAVENTASMKATTSLYVAQLSEVYLLADRANEALALAGRALELSREYKERGHQAYALRLLGEIAARREPPAVEQAEDYYRQALALAEELGMRPLMAHCHLGLGTLHLTKGRREHAHAELATAIELYRAMDMTFWLPQAEAALAQAE